MISAKYDSESAPCFLKSHPPLVSWQGDVLPWFSNLSVLEQLVDPGLGVGVGKQYPTAFPVSWYGQLNFLNSFIKYYANDIQDPFWPDCWSGSCQNGNLGATTAQALPPPYILQINLLLSVPHC